MGDDDGFNIDMDEAKKNIRKATVPPAQAPAFKKGDAAGVAKLLQGVHIVDIVPSATAFGTKLAVKTGLQVDALFENEDYPEGGFPFIDMIVMAGLPNTGKSYLAAHVALKAADMMKNKVLWIATEPTGVSQAPDLMKHKDKFDIAKPKNLEELATFVVNKLPACAGITHGAIVIDSISEVCADSEYMPVSTSDMAQPLKDRAVLLRMIKETIRELQTDALDNKTSRKPFVIIMISHLKALVRPDGARPENVILPEYRGGKLTSGYTLDGSLNNMFQYLATHILIHVDVTSKVTVGSEVTEGKQVATLIKVYPQKSRSSSRTVYQSFKISDTGLIK